MPAMATCPQGTLDPLDVEIPAVNIVEDLLLLAASTYRDPLVLA
jgi:hypothetical protein